MNSIRVPVRWCVAISAISVFTVFDDHLRAEEWIILGGDEQPLQVMIPTQDIGGAELAVSSWGAPEFDATADPWIQGTLGVGFDSGDDFKEHFSTDLLEVMKGVNASAFIRFPFELTEGDFDRVKTLALQIKYDDGFVAYLNGREVARGNGPEGAPTWDANASASHRDSDAVQFEEFPIGDISSLRPGSNVLAIHGLNTSSGGSDFLIAPRLAASDVAPPVWPDLKYREVTRASQPVAIVSAGDRSGRLFIVEQRGRIRVLEDGQLRAFLDVTDRVASGGEEGLLGLAFAPGFPDASHFYVNYTRRRPRNDGATVVSRFRLRSEQDGEGQTGDPDSEEVLLVVEQPFANHNGGDMHFGPDGFLYIGMGDGGAGGDPGNRAQAPDDLLGKMLRIDVEGTPDPDLPYAVPPSNPFVNQEGVRPEIWALGLRNPWRWSFDRLTGEMFIGDVGQNAWEEISYEPAGSKGGLNFEWRRLEGLHTHNSRTDLSVGTAAAPIVEFSQSRTGNRSITGGYVYRGTRFPRMYGTYIYGDYASRKVYGTQRGGGAAESPEWITEELDRSRYSISAFGEDDFGNLYLADYGSGRIYAVEDTVESDYLRITSVSRSDDSTIVTLGVVPGEAYQLFASEDLVNWTPAGETVQAPEDGGFLLALETTRKPQGGTGLYLQARRVD